MAKQLPSRPRLEHLKKQAKDLLKAHRAGQSQASDRLKTGLPRLAQVSIDKEGLLSIMPISAGRSYRALTLTPILTQRLFAALSKC